MNNLLDGKKTYLTGFAAIALLALQWAGLVKIPEQVYEAMLALALIFLRSGVAKSHTGEEPVVVKIRKEPPIGTGLAALCLIPWFVACALLSSCLTGCVTAPDGSKHLDVQKIAPAVRVAAWIGTEEVLKEHPDWRPGFVSAHDELTRLAADDNITFDDVIAIVHRLPVQELQSSDARLYIAAGTMMLDEFGSDLVDLNKLQQVKPITIAIADGIQLGLTGEPRPSQ